MVSMLEDEQPSDGGLEEVRASARAAVAKKAKPKRDPMVTVLLSTILIIVALTLVTVVYALLTDVLGNGAPRTMQERRLMAAAASVTEGSKEPGDWMNYVLALVEDGQYQKAQEVIDKGKKTLKDQEISADMVYMQATLDFAQGKNDKALKNSDLALKTIKDRYEKGKKDWEETGKLDKAYGFGLHDNYYNVLLLKAEICEKKKDWGTALKVYDEYLAGKQTAANVFSQRGAVKAQLGDKAGAEKDFRRTLVFIPDNADALAGLKRIGVAK